MRALIIGAASCVRDDLSRLRKMAGPLEDAFTTFGVNDGGVLWPGRLDYWCTIHGNELPEREQRRREAGGEPGYEVVVPETMHPDYRIDGGTSAFLAASKAEELGFEKKVLVGCPFSKAGYAVTHMHHGDGDWPYWRTYQEQLPVLMRRHGWIPRTMRSMSGFTAETLGEPTRDWLGIDD